MKTMLSVCVALLMILVSSVPVYCQDDSIVDNMKTVDGNVVSVDNQNSQIMIKTYEDMTFFVPSDAKIINADGFNMALSDVNVNNYVTVDYRDDKSGRHIMKGMEVEYNR